MGTNKSIKERENPRILTQNIKLKKNREEKLEN
jgi:hypothetical protein